MTIYLVMVGYHEYEIVDSAFVSEERANQRCDGLKAADGSEIPPGYYVTEVELEGVRLDEEAPR